MNDQCDPRRWLFRPSVFDSIRKPFAICMLCGVATVYGHEACERILQARAQSDRPTAGAVSPEPLHLSPQTLPAGGTTAAAYVRVLPYGPVDPQRPEPRVAPPWNTRGAA